MNLKILKIVSRIIICHRMQSKIFANYIELRVIPRKLDRYFYESS